MSQQCSVCIHSSRAEIEKELVAKVPMRTIADRWSVSKTALIRHRDNGHVSARLQKSAAGREITEADSLAAKITAWEQRTLTLYHDAVELLEKAKTNGDGRTAIAAVNAVRGIIGEARELHRLMGELSQQLQPQGSSLQIIAPILLTAMTQTGVALETRVLLAKRLTELDKTLQLEPSACPSTQAWFPPS